MGAIADIGRFLELQRTAPNISTRCTSTSARFSELEIGDTWTHKYTVVSDGDVHIGLHDREFDRPAVTFVQPELGATRAR